MIAALLAAFVVTAAPIVAADVQRAVAYWRQEPACARVDVTVGPMGPAAVAGGVLVPGSRVWAETALYGCQIQLSRGLWRDRHALPGAFCIAIAHEYGHTIGLEDTTAPGVMGPWPTRRDPECRRPPR